MKQAPIFRAMLRRNMRLFFRDKGLFFTSLITPAILLVLYATFLAKVYRDSFVVALPQGVVLSERLLDGCVGGQLISSILAVSCVTVAFCSNMLMVQDKANSVYYDLTVAPVSPSLLALGYYVASFLSTLIVCLCAMGLCLGYVAIIGWYLSFADVLLLLLDVLLLTLFGTALSSVVNFFLSTQGQISAVGSIVSSCYGFLCGAYMPISQFSTGLQRVISFLPGTYATSLLRHHALRGVFAEMEAQGLPDAVSAGFAAVTDCEISFFNHTVTTWEKLLVLCVTNLLLIGAYVVLNMWRAKKKG